jgi:hypothetical protein
MTKEIINAFHPDFVKTHMPEFLTKIRTDESRAKSSHSLTTYVEKRRVDKPSHGSVYGMSNKPISAFPKKLVMHRKGREMTMPEIHNELAEMLNKKKEKK